MAKEMNILSIINGDDYEMIDEAVRSNLADLKDYFDPDFMLSSEGAVATIEDPLVDAPFHKFMIDIAGSQSGSGTPSPSNVRAISGYSTMKITRTGKNIWSEGDVSGTRNKSVSFFMKAGTYTLSCAITTTDTDGTQNNITFTYADNTSKNVKIDRTGRPSVTVELLKNVVSIGFYAGYDYLQSTGDTFTFSDIQIELGSEATAYEAYTGNIYTIDWTSEAGTVYGGYLNIKTGILTVDYMVVDLGSLSWRYYESSGVFANSVAVNNCVKDPKACLCSSYSYNGNANSTLIANMAGSLSDYQMCAYSNEDNRGRFVVKDSRYTSAGDFTTAVTGVKLIYPLAEPLEIQLTMPEIEFLEGLNNVWADTGDVDIECYKNLKISQDLLNLITVAQNVG